MNIPQVFYILKLVAAAVVTGAGSLLTASLAGAITLPPSVVAVLTSITAVGAGLGIASGGVNAKPVPAPAPAPEETPK